MSCKNQLAVAPCSGVQVLMMTAPLGFSTRCTSFKKVPTLAKPEEPFGVGSPVTRQGNTIVTTLVCQAQKAKHSKHNQQKSCIIGHPISA